MGKGEVAHVEIVLDLPPPTGGEFHGRTHPVGPTGVLEFGHFREFMPLSIRERLVIELHPEEPVALLDAEGFQVRKGEFVRVGIKQGGDGLAGPPGGKFPAVVGADQMALTDFALGKVGPFVWTGGVGRQQTVVGKTSDDQRRFQQGVSPYCAGRNFGGKGDRLPGAAEGGDDVILGELHQVILTDGMFPVLGEREIGTGKSGNSGFNVPVLSATTIRPVPVVFPAVGVFVLESRHARGFKMEDTVHDYLKVLYPYAGRGVLVAGRRFNLAAGDVAVLPPGKVHRLEDAGGEPLSLYAICVKSSMLKQVPEAAGHLGVFKIHRRPVWAGELAGLLRGLLIEQSRTAPGGPAWVAGFAWQLLGLLWRAESSRPAELSGQVMGRAALSRARVEAYARELPQRFYEETGLESAAARLGLGRRRFSDLFREVTGESWLHAVRRERIRHARRLLSQTDRSVAAVAFESGFSDLSHFYRIFRSASGGLSPEVWRKRERQGTGGNYT